MRFAAHRRLLHAGNFVILCVSISEAFLLSTLGQLGAPPCLIRHGAVPQMQPGERHVFDDLSEEVDRAQAAAVRISDT